MGTARRKAGLLGPAVEGYRAWLVPWRIVEQLEFALFEYLD